jgi:3',5'-cyclic AMP phosphodiesterase CpdA
LEPLSHVLGNYDLYILPIGTWRDSAVLDRFAEQAARVPGRGIMVLIPDYYDAGANIRVLDPQPATLDALRHRHEWPGAVFLLRTGASAFVPLDDAFTRLIDLAHVFEGFPAGEQRDVAAADVLARQSRRSVAEKPVKILHLSDLHFGTERAAETQGYLLATLNRRFSEIDHVAITGDLFDQPRKKDAQQYKNFIYNLQLVGDTDPIVVPGNHDQRIFGNSLFGIGRRIQEIAKIAWQPIVVDREHRVVFLCFDSARAKADLAQGRIEGSQLLEMATKFDVMNRAGALDGYLRIALLHHHPYPYSEHEAPIIDPRSWIGREGFLELKDADKFLSWCAGRAVTLILHGHKHIPRLIDKWVSPGGDDRPDQRITTVGCGSSLGANKSYLSFNIVEWLPEAQSWIVDFQVDRGDGQGFQSAAVEQSQLEGSF